MFIIFQDESDVANLVVLTKIYEANHCTVLGEPIMGVRGQFAGSG